MATRAVHWHEGMFLWPHQLQLADRAYADTVQRQHKWGVHHDWGLRALDWDPADLTNGRFVVRALQARFRDGTTVSIPQDGALASLDLAPGFERDRVLTVYLAVPTLQLGKANAMERGAADGADGAERRYLLDTHDTPDENTGGDAQPITVRSLNVKLLLSTQDLAGYDVLPLARVTRADHPDAAPELDLTYIPPAVACDAWPPLQADIVQAVYDRFGKKIDVLAKQVVSRGISFDTRNPGDNLLLGQLHALNKAHGALSLLGFAEGVHPLQAYVELCRVAGQLAIFADTRRCPPLPHYDHDDLGGCFYAVKRFLDSIPIIEPGYEERPFVGVRLSMQVALEAEWLEPVWEMFVGVHSTLPPDECVKMLTREGPLDMKIGSAGNIDTIYTGGFAGLEFTPSLTPPRALPTQPDLVYFQVNRASRKEEWEKVRQAPALAIRLNTRRLVGVTSGQVDGLRELTIQTSGRQPAVMRFTLYLVRREA